MLSIKITNVEANNIYVSQTLFWISSGAAFFPPARLFDGREPHQIQSANLRFAFTGRTQLLMRFLTRLRISKEIVALDGSTSGNSH